MARTGGHFLESALDSEVSWGLRVERTGVWLATRGELAGTSAARRRGLRGRTAIADGAALVIAPSQGVHTFGLTFAIDVVAVSRIGVVRRARREVPPYRLVIAPTAFAVIELPAGTIERIGLIEGDRVVVAHVALAGGQDFCQAPSRNHPAP
jgi:uncharacterized membrane protein (UPF0127 family)